MESWDLRDPLSPKRTLIKNIKFDMKLYPRTTEAEEEEELDKKLMSQENNYLVPLDDDGGQFFWVDKYTGINVKPDGTIVYPDPGDVDDDLPYKTWKFEVYKFDITDKVSRYLDGSLEDRAIFIGLNHSFAVSAADFPGLSPNCIYFTDDYAFLPSECESFGRHDLGIYNYKEQTFEPCYFPCDCNNIKKIEPQPIWFTPIPQ